MILSPTWGMSGDPSASQVERSSSDANCTSRNVSVCVIAPSGPSDRSIVERTIRVNTPCPRCVCVIDRCSSIVTDLVAGAAAFTDANLVSPAAAAGEEPPVASRALHTKAIIASPNGTTFQGAAFERELGMMAGPVSAISARSRIKALSRAPGSSGRSPNADRTRSSILGIRVPRSCFVHIHVCLEGG